MDVSVFALCFVLRANKLGVRSFVHVGCRLLFVCCCPSERTMRLLQMQKTTLTQRYRFRKNTKILSDVLIRKWTLHCTPKKILIWIIKLIFEISNTWDIRRGTHGTDEGRRRSVDTKNCRASRLFRVALTSLSRRFYKFSTRPRASPSYLRSVSRVWDY